MRRTSALSFLLLLTACASDPPPAPPPASAPAFEVAHEPAAPAVDPGTVHMVQVPKAPDATEGTAAAAPTPTTGVTFTAPEGWIAETPSSRMRKAQFRIPGEDGADASLVVFLFGGTGGGIDANVGRWISQFTQPDGSSTADVTKRSDREVNGLPVHVADIPGTYVAETSPGSGKRVSKADYRMLGAIVTAANGSYFLKLTGPAATVAGAHDAFQAYVDSATPPAAK